MVNDGITEIRDVMEVWIACVTVVRTGVEDLAMRTKRRGTHVDHRSTQLNTWSYSPLSRLFMLQFNLTSGQLMPQFWRVVQVIERLMRDWGSPFNVKDLITAYQVKVDGFHRYKLFSKYRGDRTLVLNTVVNN
ncbi:hypothetical protein L6452_32991 [Arctium lappa]|uniref:Uncharacterized protein n=1 Tax=Arctium lappa TaxID=4217 RepID=A0ACB8ZAH8_ARCLA|nr:hypothetical protein L6452_32991 [Arctium lappa]